jgi:hypothetical protein
LHRIGLVDRNHDRQVAVGHGAEGMNAPYLVRGRCANPGTGWPALHFPIHRRTGDVVIRIGRGRAHHGQYPAQPGVDQRGHALQAK